MSDMGMADVASSLKECFNNGHDELLNRVFETIGQHGEDKETLGVALSQLGLSLDESLVSGVLAYGFVVAGKLDVALQLLARTRFQGHDMDTFSYHVLLNSLIEHVDGFCQNVSLVKSSKLFKEISEMGEVPMEPGCGIWLTNLVQSRDIDAAPQFLKSKGYSRITILRMFMIC
ncbi:hypothetical protein NC653_007821 [Populus alba x Populus x berolinensis]|uniref:Pentatricopeptide repeat-containing protein n=1 Tax=Populus alba x Populus x berolinensis TaxID=444605 RepID=A0AAD6R4Z9_9ROSI|nr:hypothetical protein NC653_007821 [Populus alba x Populus x berolinensis]